MHNAPPKDFLDDQFPNALRPVIPTTLRTAYSAAKLVAEQEPFLQVASAKANFGRLVSWSVDKAFETACQTGALPFDYEWRSFDKPTGKYLALRPSHSVVTISLVRNPARQPRQVSFRNNARLNNEPWLFDPPDEELAVRGEPHILLAHRHVDPWFAHLGIPHPHDAYDYSYRTKNLFQLPHAIESAGPPPEDTDTDFDAVQLLKEDIEKWRRDNGE
ncbi:MAG: hypothetical protein H2040_11680 [Euryhalocaulis sp.]|uniref:hypothetical protein n=1 Tax=Euryhalocaulis sp. TaxID=2744307 RepID=UPI00182555B4|nr:hypothetical protein [Euryhalocaulis sp.]MBA4802509.1 hypothetical protein [Euryhalocaulis sp.]